LNLSKLKFHLVHDHAPKLFYESNYCIGRDEALASGITSSTVFIPK
jgi:hypothetical protein